MRVSTEMQCVQNQRKSLVQYAESKDWDYTIFEEVESTRRTLPVKAEVLKKLRAKEYDGVLVYRLDRWGRSLPSLILEIQELVDKKIGFYSYAENLDFSTASGLLQFHILGAFAQFERSIISHRTKAGLQRAKEQGITLGRKKGSKDKKPRSREGYFKRYQTENQN
jgi:DNA invertase Pin-like site-specific DNA recombinase